MEKSSRKVAIVTGAASGIGKAVAQRFLRRGWALALGARDTSRVSEFLQSEGEDIQVMTGFLDLEQESSIEPFVNSALEKFGRVDTMINCAGLALGRETADQGDLDEWRKMVQTDYFGPMALTRKLLPEMKRQNSGHIINIGALAALFPHPGSAVYASAKEGIRMFLQCLREDTLGTGIRVTNIDPGITRTQFAHVRFRGDNEAVNKMLEGLTPLEPEDVAECVWFAASMPDHVNIGQITVTPTDQVSPVRVFKRQ